MTAEATVIVNGDELIREQLSATAPKILNFDQTHSTPITPAHILPQPVQTAVCLDGTWKVTRWPFVTNEDALVQASADDSTWESVQQPGKVFYLDPNENTSPDWDRVSCDHIDDNDGAILRRAAHVPEHWNGKKIYLQLDAIYPAGIIYLNGQKLGTHLSGLTPAQYDVTDLVKPGTDVVVAVRLLRKHKFLKMDMVRHAAEFAGLAQSARLFCTECVQIADYHLISDLDLSKDLGTVCGSVTVKNNRNSAFNGSVRVVLSRAADGVVAETTQPVSLVTGANVDVNIELSVNSPKRWNDEYPNLYDVAIELVGSAGDVALEKQTCAYRTGFRKLSLSPDGATLNGNYIKFRGVNHLTYHPDFGMHTPKEWLRQNLTLMKRANVNAIRTHFLSPTDLCDLCDEMGIYLCQELPIDWGTNYIHDPEWTGPAMMRLEGGLRRDRHHPSIMVWSVGNENMPQDPDVAEDGWNHMRTYHKFCKTLDPSRATMFPPPGPANAIRGIFEVRVGDIADTHYSFNHYKDFRDTGKVENPRSWKADMETHTRQQAIECGWSGVWFSSEYGIFNAIPDLHQHPYLSLITDEPEDVMGGKYSMQAFCERLEREWGLMRDDPACLGGAYFPWMCSGAGNNPWGWVRWAEDADWGVVTADLLPKPYFWAMRSIFSPIRFPMRILYQQGADHYTVKIKNHLNSINLSECTIRVQQNPGSKWMAMMRNFTDVHAELAPGQTGEIKIPIYHDGMKKALEEGKFGLSRFHVMLPNGFRMITADALVVTDPNDLKIAGARYGGGSDEQEILPIGPDAIL